MVERQPSKLRVAGSNPVSRSRMKGWSSEFFVIKRFLLFGSWRWTDDSGLNAHVAQSAEHILGKDEVTGSIPVMGSIE